MVGSPKLVNRLKALLALCRRIRAAVWTAEEQEKLELSVGFKAEVPQPAALLRTFKSGKEKSSLVKF